MLVSLRCFGAWILNPFLPRISSSPASQTATCPATSPNQPHLMQIGAQDRNSPLPHGRQRAQVFSNRRRLEVDGYSGKQAPDRPVKGYDLAVLVVVDAIGLIAAPDGKWPP